MSVAGQTIFGKLERRHIGSQRDHVILRKLLYNLFHLGACVSLAAAFLELMELAYDVGRGASGDWRNCVNAFQFRPMAGVASSSSS